MERVVLNALTEIMLCHQILAPSASLVIVFGEADPPSMHIGEWIMIQGLSLPLSRTRQGHASTSIAGFCCYRLCLVTLRLHITEFAIVVERVVSTRWQRYGDSVARYLRLRRLLSSSSEKAIHLLGAPRFFKNVFCFYREHVREITT